MLRHITALTFSLLSLISHPAGAHKDDHDLARAALEDHRVMPLSAILPAIEKKMHVRVIRIEFENDEGEYRYEFEVIDKKGHIKEVYVDGHTGKIVAPEKDGD